MSARTLSWAEEMLTRAGQLLKGHALAGRGDLQWFGATVDSRRECSGRLFFAFKGERTDGHRFAREAISHGSAAVVLENPNVALMLESTDAPTILVKNTLTALQELARAYREILDLNVIAVTGSCGKTTTKEFIRGILKRKYRAHCSPDSFNSRIGVPLTILETGEENEYLVSEVGASLPGEIDFLSRLLKPDIGVITNIGEAHIEFFRSREKIARAKGELLDHLAASGYAVLPGDDEFLLDLRARAKCRSLTFGFSESCNYQISDLREVGEANLEGTMFSFNGKPMFIKMPGVHSALNAAAALSVGDLCGVETELASGALVDVEPLPGRGNVHRGGGIVLIDDSYNANPSSMRVSLDILRQVEGKRKIAILGEMKELGEHSESSHRDLGIYLARLGLHRIFWLGESGVLVEKGFQSCSGTGSFSIFMSADDLVRAAREEIRSGDIVLVKASRACKLEYVVRELLEAMETEREN